MKTKVVPLQKQSDVPPCSVLAAARGIEVLKKRIYFSGLPLQRAR